MHPQLKPVSGHAPRLRVCMGMLTTTGGSSILAQELGAGLTAHGIETHYCHLNRAGLRPESDHLLDAEPGNQIGELLDVPSTLAGAIDAANGLLHIHDAWNFDLFHLHSLQVFGQPALLLEQLRGVPYVVTCHGSDVLSEFLMDRSREVVAYMLGKAAAVTCVSHHVAEVLTKKLPNIRPRVIPNFVRAAWRDMGACHQPEHGRLLHVSSLRSVKRPELLLEVFALVRRQLPSARLSIVTTTEGRSRLFQMIGENTEAQGIEVHIADTRRDTLEREYQRAAATLLTSRFEGFGLVVLEALAHGCPVVAPPTGALPEVLGHDWPLLSGNDRPEGLAALALRACTEAMVSQASIDSVLARYDGPAQIAAYAQLYTEILTGEQEARCRS